MYKKIDGYVLNSGAIPPFTHMSLWSGASLIKHREKFPFLLLSICAK
jgi:hypothetical protein